MEKFGQTISASLSKLGTSTLDLLRKNNLLVPLVRNQLIEQMTADLKPPEELVRKALEKHCQNQQFKDEAELTEWLKDNHLSRDELLNQLSLPLKLSKCALDHYGLQAEARFLQCKEELDQVIYSLVRVKDSGMAYELYLQLEANEASFETLASDHSEGPEQRSGGRVGPGSLKRAHPRLQQLLRTATPGVVQEPILIEQWWVVARLEERQEASFDDAMRQRMASELFQEWLTSETKTVVKSLLSAENDISMP